KDGIVSQGQLLDLDARIMPGGYVARARRAFVEHAFFPEIGGWIKICHAVQKHAGRVRIGEVAGGHVRGGEVAAAAHDSLLPLAENQVGPDEPPALASL